MKRHAQKLGFDLVGIAEATEADTFGALSDWLSRDYAGEMTYMHRHAEARRHPASILPAVKSVVMVGMNYHIEPIPSDSGTKCAKIARYALGEDYHHVLRRRLKALLAWLQGQAPGCWGRGVVDTAPLLERDFARRAGLGWFGKNTMLLNKKLGSYFFLGGLLVDRELVPDMPHETSHCGTCTACLDACPTQAFVGPGQLDARRCLSYLNIELHGPVAEELRPMMNDWLFGCDICQEVCPWNRKAPIAVESSFMPKTDLLALDLAEILSVSEEEFKKRFRGTALLRTGRSGLLRTAALILGNRGDLSALPALEKASKDPDGTVSEACRWAITRIRNPH
ncbi:MAG: tRNA epoxyqueuosine(34) reductase QueG [Gemmataceae bacterium]